MLRVPATCPDPSSLFMCACWLVSAMHACACVHACFCACAFKCRPIPRLRLCFSGYGVTRVQSIEGQELGRSTTVRGAKHSEKLAVAPLRGAEYHKHKVRRVSTVEDAGDRNPNAKKTAPKIAPRSSSEGKALKGGRMAMGQRPTLSETFCGFYGITTAGARTGSQQRVKMLAWLSRVGGKR